MRISPLAARRVKKMPMLGPGGSAGPGGRQQLGPIGRRNKKMAMRGPGGMPGPGGRPQMPPQMSQIQLNEDVDPAAHLYPGGPQSIPSPDPFQFMQALFGGGTELGMDRRGGHFGGPQEMPVGFEGSLPGMHPGQPLPNWLLRLAQGEMLGPVGRRNRNDYLGSMGRGPVGGRGPKPFRPGLPGRGGPLPFIGR